MERAQASGASAARGLPRRIAVCWAMFRRVGEEPSEFRSQGARRGGAVRGREEEEDEEEEEPRSKRGADGSTRGARGEGAGVRQDDEEI